MNNTVGIKQVFSQKEALTIVARSLNPSKEAVMLEALRVSRTYRDATIFGAFYASYCCIRLCWVYCHQYHCHDVDINYARKMLVKCGMLSELSIIVLAPCLLIPLNAGLCLQVLAPVCLIPPDGHLRAITAITESGEMKNHGSDAKTSDRSVSRSFRSV